MSVKARRKVQGKGQVKYEVSAADILKDDHPVHKHFVSWCGDKTPTKRQARAFLAEYPQYRGK